MPIFLPLFRPYIKKVTTPELFPKLMLATAAKPEAEPRSLLKGIILTKPVNKNQVDSDVCPRFNHLVLSFWCFSLPSKSSTVPGSTHIKYVPRWKSSWSFFRCKTCRQLPKFSQSRAAFWSVKTSSKASFELNAHQTQS